ncbi:hypothetical protein M5K25_011677 [Dendrobium thyrsiflorum]|uniref:E2 ubiquitin-conjugating enzyme n=1 Tax=Dendrobium thyrsiflorum TaxID=117978 RepID=A0ABD0V3S2_DENTH
MEVRNEENASAAPAFSKQPRPAPASVDSAAVSQRLQKELMSLMMSGNLGVSAFPESENIFSWIGTIDGGKGTPYEGLSYKLSLRFPLEYPFKPPKVKFETSCFHPNVDQFGNICLDILQDMWSSAYDCRTVLLSIQSLLGEPNNDSPLNSYAATLWSNQEDYKRMVNKQYMEGVEQLERLDDNLEASAWIAKVFHACFKLSAHFEWMKLDLSKHGDWDLIRENYHL